MDIKHLAKCQMKDLRIDPDWWLVGEEKYPTAPWNGCLIVIFTITTHHMAASQDI